MEEEKYSYFVSYLSTGGGFGRVRVTTELPITGIEDIAKIEERLRQDHKGVQIVIMYWRRFDEPE